MLVLEMPSPIGEASPPLPAQPAPHDRVAVQERPAGPAKGVRVGCDDNWVVAVELADVETWPAAGHQLQRVEHVVPLDSLMRAVFVNARREPTFGRRANGYRERVPVLNQDPYPGGGVPVEDVHAAGDEATPPPAVVVGHQEVELDLAEAPELTPPRMDGHVTIVARTGPPASPNSLTCPDGQVSGFRPHIVTPEAAS